VFCSSLIVLYRKMVHTKKSFGTEEKQSEFFKRSRRVMEIGIYKLNLKSGCVTTLLKFNDHKNSPCPSKEKLQIATDQTVSMLQDNYPKMVAKNVSYFHTIILLYLFFCFLFYCLGLYSYIHPEHDTDTFTQMLVIVYCLGSYLFLDALVLIGTYLFLDALVLIGKKLFSTSTPFPHCFNINYDLKLNICSRTGAYVVHCTLLLAQLDVQLIP